MCAIELLVNKFSFLIRKHVKTSNVRPKNNLVLLFHTNATLFDINMYADFEYFSHGKLEAS